MRKWELDRSLPIKFLTPGIYFNRGWRGWGLYLLNIKIISRTKFESAQKRDAPEFIPSGGEVGAYKYIKIKQKDVKWKKKPSWV
jgi:hypothetical protein